MKMTGGLLLLLVLYLSTFINRTEYPALQVVDLKEFRLEAPNLQCEDGCDMVEPPVSLVDCVAVQDLETQTESQTVNIGLSPYVCSPAEVSLGETVQFVVSSLDCQFSDEGRHLLLTKSCHLNFSLKLNSQPRSNYPMRLFLSLLLFTFTMLFLREHIIRTSQPVTLPLPIVEEVIADSKEPSGSEEHDSQRSRREERVFRQGHSFLRERSKSRVRSRSRRRD